ncbi:MAG: polysaccharide biosynthesis tyrosine autokinase [bacterium]|nr:polysaccharide biosynthesis tyrosine autokinase [bacterium]
MDKGGFNFYDYLRIFRRRFKIVILTFVVVTVVSSVYTRRQNPVYEAVTRVKVIESATSQELLTALIAYNPADVMASEVQMIKSHIVMEEAARRLGLIKAESTPLEVEHAVARLQGAVSAEQVKSTNIIEIKALSSDPEVATQIVNAVAYAYKGKRTEEKRRQVKEAREFIESQIDIIGSKLRTAEDALRIFVKNRMSEGQVYLPGSKDKVADLEFTLYQLRQTYTDWYPKVQQLKAQVDSLKQEAKIWESSEIERERLAREVTLSADMYSLLNTKYREALIAEAEKTEPVTIINPAVVPVSPINPRKTINIVIGALMGLFIGFVFAFVAENIDTSIGRIEDVEDYLKLPVLGIIPQIKFDKTTGETEFALEKQLITHYSPKSSVAESYRILQTNIDFALMDKNIHTILFTSTIHEEGKTLSAINCAVAMAQAGKKTLLVESDLRRPRLHRLFGVSKEPGLTDLLLRKLKFEDVKKGAVDFVLGKMGMEGVTKTPGIENLTFISSGYLPPNLIGVLNSRAFTDFVDKVKKAFDIVIFDCPPILPLPDAAVLGSKIESAILVHQAGKVARRALYRAKIALEHTKTDIIGIVLNNIKAYELEPDTGYYYSKYYRYKYTEEKPRVRKFFKKRTKV